MLGDITDYCTLQQGPLPLTETTFNLRECVEEVLLMLGTWASSELHIGYEMQQVCFLVLGGL